MLENFKNLFFTKISKKVFLVLFIFLAIIGINYTSIKIDNLTIVANYTKTLDKDLQAYFTGGEKGLITYSGTIYKNWFSQNTVRINYKDCLESLVVNNKFIFLDNLEDKLCSSEGIELYLSPYLTQGKNQIYLNINANNPSESGLVIRPTLSDPVFLVFILIIYFCLIFLLSSFFKKIGIDELQQIIFWLAILVSIIYLNNTNFNLRHHDAVGETGHFGYIHYVAKNLSLPNLDGWQFYQPPLYYILSAIWYNFFKFLNFVNIWNWLQVVSLFYYSLYLIFNYLNVKKFLKNYFYQTLAIFLISIWPNGIIHSIRISNDLLFYLWYSIAIYCILTWVETGKNKFLYLNALVIALGFLTKSNTIIYLSISLVTILSVFYFKYFLKTQRSNSKNLNLEKESDSCQQSDILNLQTFKNWWQKIILILEENYQKLAIFIGIISLGILGNLGRTLYYYLQGDRRNWIVGNIHALNSGLLVSNQIKNFLYFDFKAFLHYPFDIWTDEGGRQYFWSVLLKTSLFGEFSFFSDLQKNLAYLLYLILLWFVLFILFKTCFLKKTDLENKLFFLLKVWNIIIPVLFAIIYRVYKPYSVNNDIRFIFPFLPFLIIYYLFLLSKVKTFFVLKYFNLFLILFFGTCSILFFLFY